jgi:6-pyruvoyltetrahydropterin/6-carboxytetrahydropterin synthase
MSRTTVLHIRNQYLKFSAAHFTIFSATERERIHGHNFAVSAQITAAVGEDGLCFDYNVMKKRLRDLCDALDEYVLLPGRSPHLTVEHAGDQVHAVFNGETLSFPAADTLVLPLANITSEELSWYLLEQMLEGEAASRYDLSEMVVTVASGAGQSASTRWDQERGTL